MSGKAACRLQKCLRSKRHTRFACTGGAAPRRPGKCRTAACLLRRQQGYPPQAARIIFGLCDTAMQCAASRFAKPRNSIAREACRLDRGRLSACQKVSKRETDCYFLRRAKSNTKSTRGKPCDLGSKLYRIIFFVLLPSLVPKPVCGATRFFGCFEPVRKGNYSADARLLLFENGMSYCKLTVANVFKKGSCSLLLLRWEFVFAVCGLKFRDIPKFLLSFKTAAL